MADVSCHIEGTWIIQDSIPNFPVGKTHSIFFFKYTSAGEIKISIQWDIFQQKIELLIDVATWMNLENMLSESKQT